MLVEVHTDAYERRYRAHTCSIAILFAIAIAAVTYTIPMYLAHQSLGFWLKIDSYREQAEINFKHQFFVLLEGRETSIGYSTFDNINNFVLADRLRLPNVKSYESDVNGDGKNDYLTFDLSMPVQPREKFERINLLLFFDYKLHVNNLWTTASSKKDLRILISLNLMVAIPEKFQVIFLSKNDESIGINIDGSFIKCSNEVELLGTFSSLRMESMALINAESSLGGNQFDLDGSLVLNQKVLLPHKGNVDFYNVPIIKKDTEDLHELQLGNIFRDYQTRNISTYFVGGYPVWSGIAGSSAAFTIRIRVYYPDQTITYRPGFWQMLKFAWIQYLAVLVVFLWLFAHVKRFVYSNQIVTTLESPVKLHAD